MKGYWIVSVDVTNAESFAEYATAVQAVLAKYHAKYLTRGGQYKCVEGTSRSRNTIVEFPTYESALECWHSPEYQAVAALRKHAGKVDIVIVEAYAGTQPQ